MTEAKKKLLVTALAATVMLALALGGLGLTSLNVTPAFATDGSDVTTAPAANTVKVKYKGTGGAKNANPTDVKKGATLKLKKASKPGYTFKGWYQGKKKVTKVKTTKATTLTAKWAPKTYKIKYKSVKGTNKNAKTFKYGKAVKLKSLSKKGYTFLGWYSDKYLTKKVSKVGGKTAKNATVYAKWVQKPRNAEEKIALKAAKAAIKQVNDEGATLVSTLLLQQTGAWIDPAGKKIGCSKKLLVDTMRQQTVFSSKTITFVAGNTGANWYQQALMTADYFADVSSDYLEEGVTAKDLAKIALDALGFTKAEINYALQNMKA